MSWSLFKPATPLRTKIGVVITALYLIGLISLIYWKRGEITGMPLNELGDFAAGAFGPLAFLWLVIGYMQQGDELKQNTDALRIQALELANNVEQQRLLVDLGREQLASEKTQHQKELEERNYAARPRFAVCIWEYPSKNRDFFEMAVQAKNSGPSCSHLSAYSKFNALYFSVTESEKHTQTWIIRIKTLNIDDFNDFKFYLAYIDRNGNPNFQFVNCTCTDYEYKFLGEDHERLFKEQVKVLGEENL